MTTQTTLELRKENITDNVLDECLIASPADGQVAAFVIFATVLTKDGAAGGIRQTDTQSFVLHVLREGANVAHVLSTPVALGTNVRGGSTLSVTWTAAVSGTTVILKVTANTSATIAGSDEFDADFKIFRHGDPIPIVVQA